MVPPTPPSLVKLYWSTCSSMRGAGSSAPISDQVPELMYAQFAPWAGTAATAEPVSCDAGAMTGAAFRPVSTAMVCRSGPRTVPGATTVPLYRAELYDQGFEPHQVKAALLAAANGADYYVDISAHIDTKIKALEAHYSQLGAYGGLGDRIREMAKLVAEQGGTEYEYAEAFKGFFFEIRPSGQGS